MQCTTCRSWPSRRRVVAGTTAPFHILSDTALVRPTSFLRSFTRHTHTTCTNVLHLLTIGGGGIAIDQTGRPPHVLHLVSEAIDSLPLGWPLEGALQSLALHPMPRSACA
jgi:hypothetical protein